MLTEREIACGDPDCPIPPGILVPIVADPAFPRQMLLNVNAPGEVPGKVGGARATRLGRRIYNDELQLQSDVDGRRQYLIYGCLLYTSPSPRDS